TFDCACLCPYGQPLIEAGQRARRLLRIIGAGGTLAVLHDLLDVVVDLPTNFLGLTGDGALSRLAGVGLHVLAFDLQRTGVGLDHLVRAAQLAVVRNLPGDRADLRLPDRDSRGCPAGVQGESQGDPAKRQAFHRHTWVSTLT